MMMEGMKEIDREREIGVECQEMGEGPAPVYLQGRTEVDLTAVNFKIIIHVTIMACTGCSQSFFTFLFIFYFF